LGGGLHPSTPQNYQHSWEPTLTHKINTARKTQE
jgi:hypothetical protein